MAKEPLTVLYLGGSGQIGSHFVRSQQEKYNIVAPSHDELDVKDVDGIKTAIDVYSPDRIVYSAGFTNIDQGPNYPDEVIALNATGVEKTAVLAAEKKIPLIYLSTQTVFNGKKIDRPYTEDDQPDPLSLVSKSKRLGEIATLDTSSQNAVIRLIICYSGNYPRRSDIARMVLGRLKNGQEFTATDDQEINPIYVGHLADAISAVMDSQATGLYHVGATNYTTPYEFCRSIARKFGFDTKLIKSTKFEDFAKTRPEPRLHHEWLSVQKFVNDFGNGSLHSLDEGIDQFAKDFS